jgi:hypothetical protein
MEDDSVRGVVERLDRPWPEQHSGAVVGAVDGEHKSTLRTNWIVGKVQFVTFYAYQFC